MKRLELSAFGLDHLHLVEAPLPEPGPREIRVRIRALSLNYRDLVLAEGSYLPNLALPIVPLSDGAGIVDAVGAEVSRFRIGDRVIGHYTRDWLAGRPKPEYQHNKLGGPLPGLAAEYVVMPESAWVATPAKLSDAEASTLPIAALTAWNALDALGLSPGASVLTQGSGGVSLFALQLAKARGLKVIALTRSAAKCEALRALGADIVIDTRAEPDWPAAVLRLTRDEGVDGVIDVLGGQSLVQSLTALASGGTLAAVGFLEGLGQPIPDPTRFFVQKWARIIGISVGHRDSFDTMNRALDVLDLHPVIARRFPFDSAADAYRHLKSGEAFGKIVLTL